MRGGVRSLLRFAICNFYFPLGFLIPSVCFGGVSVEGQVDRATITVGDPITYSLTVRRGEADRVSFPEIREAVGELEVRDVEKEELRKVDGGGVEEAARYILTSYVVGAIEIPALSITFVTASGDTGEARTHPIPITVQSVIEEGDEKVLKDVKPPVELAGGLPWWIWTLIGLSLIGIAIYLIHRRRARRSGARGVQKAPPRPIDELGEFDKIAALGLLEKGAFKRHYILVSDAMRRYIERRYALEAMERTTWEILSEMNSSRMDPVTVAKFDGFLSNCDLVKFAKLIPPKDEMEGVIDRAKDVVRETMRLPEGDAEKSLIQNRP